ncbi:hypothetical protein LTS10_003612 [Elasticomyces elasticus]|nr:hypothetical protein LTS10_003612 [Elasticomyces elasticus]
MPPIHVNGMALSVPRGYSSWSLIGGHMIRDDQIGGSRRDSDVVERRDRPKERYGPPARDRSERPVVDRYGRTWAETHDREDRNRRTARSVPRIPPTQSTHNDIVAYGGIDCLSVEAADLPAEFTALKHNEANEYGLAVGAGSVKGEGDGDATTSGDGSIIKAESCAHPEAKQVKTEQGAMEVNSKALVKLEDGFHIKVEPGSYAIGSIPEQTKAEHVDTIKIKVEGGDE